MGQRETDQAWVLTPPRRGLRGGGGGHGPRDNGAVLTPFKGEHVYGYLEEIDLIVPETCVKSHGTFMDYLSQESQLEKFMPTLGLGE